MPLRASVPRPPASTRGLRIGYPLWWAEPSPSGAGVEPGSVTRGLRGSNSTSEDGQFGVSNRKARRKAERLQRKQAKCAKPVGHLIHFEPIREQPLECGFKGTAREPPCTGAVRGITGTSPHRHHCLTNPAPLRCPIPQGKSSSRGGAARPEVMLMQLVTPQGAVTAASSRMNVSIARVPLRLTGSARPV